MSCPRNRKTCRGGHLCIGCKRDQTQRAKVEAELRAKACCSIKRTDGWPCDRPPHEGRVHRNAVLGEMWLG